jgi:O-antigen/teichoic acid export membrane protein
MGLMNKVKTYAGDLIYSMIGLVVMNGVIQLVLYPYLNRQLGADAFGRVLSLISVVAIMGSTFGVAANYSRMVSETKREASNGDYNIFLLIIAGVSILVSLVSMIWLKEFTLTGYIGFYLLMVVTTLRYYADVEFRLTVNYKRFLVFYLMISAGYVLGVLIYPVTHSWIIAMLAGEAAAVLYVVCKGHIFSKPYFQKSGQFKNNMVSLAFMSGTELIAALILNADRLMLQAFAGGTAVTIFYTATLVGKIVSLVSTPLNGVVIGHLSKYKGGLSSKNFGLICLAGAVLGVLINVACVGVSYVFVKIMYPDIFEMARPYFWIANAGQVFYFVSGTLTVILLRFTDEKYQLYINIIYLIIFLAISFPMVILYELWGMAAALLIVNVLKVFVIMVVGMKLLK